MKKYWTISGVTVFIMAFLIWGHIKCIAAEEDKSLSITKPERFYSIRLSKKLDEVIKNQELILKQLDELKKAVKQ